MEGFHQVVGQATHQPHGVNEHDGGAFRQLERPGSGVQGSEQLVFRQDARLG